MKFLLSFILFLVPLLLGAQTEYLSYIYNPKKDKGNTNQKVHRALLQKLAEREQIKHSCYKLDDKGQIVFTPEYSYDDKEYASRYLMFYDFNVPVNYKPPVKVNKNQKGKIVSVYFELPKKYITVIKVVDITTNEIKLINSKTSEHTSIFEDESNIVKIKDYKKHLTADPTALKKKNRKRYNAAVSKLHKKYHKRFASYYEEKIKKAANQFAKMDRVLNYPEYLAVKEVEMKGKRAKYLKMDVQDSIDISEWGSMKVFTLDTFQNYVYPNLFGHYYPEDERDESGNFVLKKTLFSKSKKIGEAHKNGEQLYVSFADEGYSTKLNKEENDIGLGIDLDMFTIAGIEQELSRIRMIKLVDKQSFEIVDQFRELYKQERFMDAMIIPEARGIEYLVAVSNGNIQITNTETGHLEASIPLKEGFDGMYDALLDILNMEIEVIEVTKERRNKVKKARVYSPLGFWNYQRLDMYEIREEVINGKTLERPVKIGQAECYGDEDGQYVAEINIKDGKKELYKALKEEKKIRFRNEDYRFRLF